ncbi:MAG: alpha/beta hydrolase, partial [Phenylobacterium sp.]|nr:alpha/beta hydrolase [Phenylobacterium sp.]
MKKHPAAAYLTAGFTLAALAGAVIGVVRSRMVWTSNRPNGAFVGRPRGRLHYVQRGSGPDVVLIHGAATNLQEMLAGPVDTLSARYRVTVFDRPGHGHSQGDLRRASAVDQAEAIRAAVNELGLVRPVIVGHSLGGAVALAYGAAYPDEISGVLALAPLAYPGWGPGHIGPAAHVVPGAGFLFSRSLFALWDPALMNRALRAIFLPQKPTERFEREFPKAMSGLPSAMRADGADFVQTSVALHQLSQSYGAYPARVAIIVGAKDKILSPKRQAERLAKEIPGASLTVLPGLGHMFHHFAP